MINRLISLFFLIHTLFAVFLGRLFALAPDEGAYLYTFNNLYGSSSDANPQYNSGWITAPKIFLWLSYLPAKILNMIGVPDYLSIRLLSIFLTTLSLYLLIDIQKRSNFGHKISQKSIFLVFFIPSIFLWTSVGLRESFIIAETAAFLAGFNFLMQGKNKRGYGLLFLGSYGLLSTKSYLWACLMVALIVSCIVLVLQHIDRRTILKFISAGLLVPVITFASTTSIYALNFIFKSDISVTGERSGDSISQIYVETPGTGSGTVSETESRAGRGTSTGTGSGTESGTESRTESGTESGTESRTESRAGRGTSTGTGSGTVSGTESRAGRGTSTGTESGTKPKKELITFHGDYSLIALHFYLLDNPNSLFSRALGVLRVDKKIQIMWDEKVRLGLIHKDKKVGKDTSSLNGHILKPGKISEPLSMIWPAFVFLFGPFPFVGDPGFAVGIASLESPLWWAFYALVIFQFIRFRKVKFLQDPPILLTLVFLAGEIAFSALVEVNLGTSFRHRSILLVPLVFLYVRLAQRAKEQKDLELGII